MSNACVRIECNAQSITEKDIVFKCSPKLISSFTDETKIGYHEEKGNLKISTKKTVVKKIFRMANTVRTFWYVRACNNYNTKHHKTYSKFVNFLYI